MSAPRAPPSLGLATAAMAILAVLAAALATTARAQTCGSQAGGARCPNCLCCSRFGFCGSGSEWCGAGCQSQCSGCPAPPGPGGQGVASIVSRDLFERLLLHRNDAACLARGFYTYDAFLAAAAAFPAFAGTSEGLSVETRKREVAAFLGQTSHETTGGWPSAPDGPFSWGYCFKQERDPPSDYCQPRPEWPCAPGRRYYGRGPMQLSFNYNYGPAGRAIGVDLLNNPDLVAADPVVAFKTALWFWMTPQANKPSSHAVITGRWTPTGADNAAGRVPGYGVITNIINGGLECGRGQDPRVVDRIGFYKRYCDVLGVGYGSNLDCNSQRPFTSGASAGLAAQ
ncbi:hypothetical protein VPH35_009206 [Triticum aestivum]|uniref:chitinase 2-like n=1 Tax=Triticum aestivum TaxID=4565 RepID=UPI00194A83D6|nr:chitinase 2-like [Triticum aestivum]